METEFHLQSRKEKLRIKEESFEIELIKFDKLTKYLKFKNYKLLIDIHIHH